MVAMDKRAKAGYRPYYASWAGVGVALGLGTYYLYRQNRRENRQVQNDQTSNPSEAPRLDEPVQTLLDVIPNEWQEVKEAPKKMENSETEADAKAKGSSAAFDRIKAGFDHQD
eukprot:TCALIF_08570-PA protein Name:"Protein of unknown function" AED:0.07 eAED:0.07 QI:0/0.5/0.33/0.66/0.5/0.66/3/40/112